MPRMTVKKYHTLNVIAISINAKPNIACKPYRKVCVA